MHQDKQHNGGHQPQYDGHNMHSGVKIEHGGHNVDHLMSESKGHYEDFEVHGSETTEMAQFRYDEEEERRFEEERRELKRQEIIYENA